VVVTDGAVLVGGHELKSCLDRNVDEVGDAPLEVGGPVRVDAIGCQGVLEPRRAEVVTGAS
jgi:hypothetical protein